MIRNVQLDIAGYPTVYGETTLRRQRTTIYVEPLAATGSVDVSFKGDSVTGPLPVTLTLTATETEQLITLLTAARKKT